MGVFISHHDDKIQSYHGPFSHSSFSTLRIFYTPQIPPNRCQVLQFQLSSLFPLETSEVRDIKLRKRLQDKGDSTNETHPKWYC